MLSLFRRLILFLCCVVLSYLLVLTLVSTLVCGTPFEYYVRKYTNVPLGIAPRGGNTVFRFRDVETFEDVDILFIGSSHCYRGFDPRFFEQHRLSVFNLGSTSQSPLNSFYLLRRYLDDLRPEVLVVETYWEVMAFDGTESTLDLAANTAPSGELYAMTLATRNARAINGVLSNLLNFRQQPIDQVVPELPSVDEYIHGGFVETTRVEFHDPRRLEPHDVDVNSVQTRYLARIIEMALSRGIEPVLVTAPVSETYFRAVANYDHWRSLVEELAASFDVRYIDFNDDPELTATSLFYDLDHLNQKGVRLFNGKLYRQLMAMPGVMEVLSR